jgi:hypothetical protein
VSITAKAVDDTENNQSAKAVECNVVEFEKSDIVNIPEHNNTYFTKYQYDEQITTEFLYAALHMRTHFIPVLQW